MLVFAPRPLPVLGGAWGSMYRIYMLLLQVSLYSWIKLATKKVVFNYSSVLKTNILMFNHITTLGY